MKQLHFRKDYFAQFNYQKVASIQVPLESIVKRDIMIISCLKEHHIIFMKKEWNVYLAPTAQ